jgi:hypothetical protein
MGWVAFVSCFIHDGDEYGTAFSGQRILSRTLEFQVLYLTSSQQTIRTSTYRELAFLATMRSNTVFFSSGCTDVVNHVSTDSYLDEVR